MDYYDKKHFLAVVDRDDKIIDRVEKWKAHEEGILHRAFTVGIKVGDSWVVQHRKHPVFDSVLDVSASSHPVYTDEESEESIEDMSGFTLDTLDREWNIKNYDKQKIEHKGSFYYKAEDPLSKYIEHEICHFYVVKIDELPKPNNEFAYGYSLVPTSVLTNELNMLQYALAPWCVPIVPFLS